MRDMRLERTRRAGVREERLRATAGLRQALPLSSWRGRSGRRYVVGVHALSEPGIGDWTDAVLIAIHRAGDGTAHVVDIETAGPRPRGAAREHWMSRVRARGATELHVHRLAESDDERLAIAEDLRDQADALPQG